jgi:hypothetical protein
VPKQMLLLGVAPEIHFDKYFSLNLTKFAGHVEKNET